MIPSREGCLTRRAGEAGLPKVGYGSPRLTPTNYGGLLPYATYRTESLRQGPTEKNLHRSPILSSRRACSFAPGPAYCDRPLSVAYFVLSFGTASWPFLIVVSTLTVVSVVTIVVSWVRLSVTTVSFVGPMRSVCPP